VPSTNAWAELDARVLAALDDTPRTSGELNVDLDQATVRTVLHQNVSARLVAEHIGTVRTTYTLTEAGRRHLTNVVEVA